MCDESFGRVVRVSQTISVGAEYEVQNQEDCPCYQNLDDELLGVFCHLVLLSQDLSVVLFASVSHDRQVSICFVQLAICSDQSSIHTLNKISGFSRIN